MKKFDLTHARHDSAHCLVPGLFRSLKKGERKTAKLDVTYAHGKNSVRFWGPEPLGADDLRVLQGLVALAGPAGLTLPPEPSTETGRALRNALETKWDAVNQDALVTSCGISQLAREIGLTAGGAQYKAIRGSIERLWAVSVIVERDGRRRGFRILSDYASDESAGTLHVALNPLIASAVTGDEKQHVRIEMSEVRALRSDAARLIQQRLCGWINPGVAGRVTIDTLCGYVWPDATNANAAKRRRGLARKALGELADVAGWGVTEYAAGKWEIRRPAA